MKCLQLLFPKTCLITLIVNIFLEGLGQFLHLNAAAQ